VEEVGVDREILDQDVTATNSAPSVRLQKEPCIRG